MSTARGSPAHLDDTELVSALSEGDDGAFAWLVERHSSAMLRVAATQVPSRAVAEEVVQETWLAVIRGLDRFEGRSSLKTWIFRILSNIASSRGVGERRTTPFCALAGDAGDRFEADGHWRVAPTPW